MARVAWYSTLSRGIPSVENRPPPARPIITRVYWKATRICVVGRQSTVPPKRHCRPSDASSKMATAP